MGTFTGDAWLAPIVRGNNFAVELKQIANMVRNSLRVCTPFVLMQGKESVLLRLKDTRSHSIFSLSFPILVINLASWPNLDEAFMR